jgi:hypothetical protein
MRGIFRFLLCSLLSTSIAFAAVPRQPLVIAEVHKDDCCAMMKTPSANHECERHPPKHDSDQQCCAACVSCVATIAVAVGSFVYPPVGEQAFAHYISSEHLRSDRPPVPPPRA